MRAPMTIGTPNLRLIQHLRVTVVAPPDLGQPDVVAQFALARLRLVGALGPLLAGSVAGGTGGSGGGGLGGMLGSLLGGGSSAASGSSGPSGSTSMLASGRPWRACASPSWPPASGASRT